MESVCVFDNEASSKRCNGMSCEMSYECEFYCYDGICSNDKPEST